MKSPTSLSELNYMLRQLEADETVPPPNYIEEDEPKAWTVLDSFVTIAMDEIKKEGLRHHSSKNTFLKN